MISIIIVNHNTYRVLEECVESVSRLEAAEGFEIIIIDNCSKDNSIDAIEYLAIKYNNVKVIFLDELKSFSFANNTGIKQAKGDYILIMNPDIIFTEPVLTYLVNSIKADNAIGSITPALVGIDGNFQRNYFQRYPSIRQFIFYYSMFAKFFNCSAKRMNKYLENQDIDISVKKLYYTEQIPFAFFLTTRNVLDKTGLPDENFILFFEDVDLSYRISRKFKLAVDTSLKVTHLGGSSMGKDNPRLYGIFIKSMVYFFEKHYSSRSVFLLRLLIKLNSYCIIFIEQLKYIIGRQDKNRIIKHKYTIDRLRDQF